VAGALAGGPEILFYHYIYNGEFLAPHSVTPVAKVELSVKLLFHDIFNLCYSAYTVE
jgi:hypothetical protein